MDNLELNLLGGQIRVDMKEAAFDKFSLEDAGMRDPYEIEGGNLRIKIEMGYIQDYRLYKMPLIELNYTEKIGVSEWIVEFNGTNILEKTDNSGQATILLLNRKKMEELVQRHENTLIIHGDFSEVTHLTSDTFFQLLEEPGS